MVKAFVPQDNIIYVDVGDDEEFQVHIIHKDKYAVMGITPSMYPAQLIYTEVRDGEDARVHKGQFRDKVDNLGGELVELEDLVKITLKGVIEYLLGVLQAYLQKPPDSHTQP